MSGASRVSQEITGNSLQLTNDKQFYSTIFRARLSLRETTLVQLVNVSCWWANNKKVKWERKITNVIWTRISGKIRQQTLIFLVNKAVKWITWWFTSEVNESSRNLHSGRQTPWEWVRLCMRYTHAGRQLQTNFAKIMSGSPGTKASSSQQGISE